MEYYGDDVGDNMFGCPESIVGFWSRNNKEQYKQWNDAENASIEASVENPDPVFGSMRCPLCRKKYKRV